MSELKAEEWVFAGMRLGDKQKPYYIWYVLPEAVETWTFDKKIVPASVGGVYQMHTLNEGKTVRTSGEGAPKYLRRHENAEIIRTWAAKEQAAEQAKALKSLNTKAAKVEPIEDMLINLRRITTNLNRTERRALMSLIADEIFHV